MKLRQYILVSSLAFILSACFTRPTAPDNDIIISHLPSRPVTANQPAEKQIPTDSHAGVAAADGRESDKTDETSYNNDVWNRIRDQLKLERHLHRPQVQEKIAWYKRHQDYIDRVVERADPYLYYIVEQIEQRGMPMDIALLPIIESAFQPFAYSPARASGIWQFIPRTGLHYGLKQNWWYDGRRDITAATNAALDYLQKLEQDFNGDWLLVVAAYNSGEGNVAKAIRQNQRAGKPTDFFSLKLPRETRGYVPSLLAVAEVVGNSSVHNIKLKPIANKPYFTSIDIGSQLDLSLAAEMAGLSMDDLYTLNPGFNQWATTPEGPHKLLIPTDRAEQFVIKLNQVPKAERISWQQHVIKQGESLSAIADRYYTDVTTLKQANKLRSNVIHSGHSLLIPAAKQAAQFYTMSLDSRRFRGLTKADGNRYIYTVRRGDNLWDISRQYAVSVNELTTWNGISANAYLQPKQKLTLWVKGRAATDTGTMDDINYTVKQGDSLWYIARRFNTTVAKLKAWNNLPENQYLQPGQTLILYPREA